MGILSIFRRQKSTPEEEKLTKTQEETVELMQKETLLYAQAMGMEWSGVWKLTDKDFAVEKNSDFYDLILKDAMIAGLIETRLLISSTMWEVVADDDINDNEERKILNAKGAETVARIIENIPRWKRFLRTTLESKIKGITFQEIIWDMINSRTEICYINSKEKNYFSFSREHSKEPPAQNYKFDNSVRGWMYLGDEGYMVNGKFDLRLFQNKFFLAVDNETLDNPWGRGLGHSIYWTWFYKKITNKFWMRFMEKFSAPWLIGTTDGAVSQSKLLSILSEAANSPIIALPKDCDLKFEKVDGHAYSTMQSFIEYCDKKLAIAILGQDSTSQTPSNAGVFGTGGIANIHNKVKEDIRQDDLDYLNDVINYGTQYSPGLVQMILNLNFTTGVVPRVKFRLSYEANNDKIETAKLINILVRSGMKFNSQKVAEELEIEGLLAEEGDEVLEVPDINKEDMINNSEESLAFKI